MSAWPDSMKVGPIREWPGAMTRIRLRSPFRRQDGTPVTLTTTLTLLNRELVALGARNAELLIAIDAGQFRQDGRPYANAKAAHPGIILTFEIPKVGVVSYPSDQYTAWEDNLRAVALALEALRKVDRYGVTKHGEQYRGFRALEATAAPAGFDNAGDALMFLASVTGMRYADHPTRNLVAAAQRMTHPDRGGDATVFQRVSLAQEQLRKEGRL